MTQSEKAVQFASLHKKGKPLVLYNIWDAGSAKAVADAGADAIATGSWSVAAAQGYSDGEELPLEFLLTIAERIVAAVDLPVTVDFEGGYAVESAQIADNVAKLMDIGVIGINFEDQVIGGEGLHDLTLQTQRIAAVRKVADERGLPFFINARTDYFLQESDGSRHTDLLHKAIERAAAYREAGASGIFLPGLVKSDLIAKACAEIELPVNIFKLPHAPSIEELAKASVARISHGPIPFRKMIAEIPVAMEQALAS